MKPQDTNEKSIVFFEARPESDTAPQPGEESPVIIIERDETVVANVHPRRRRWMFIVAAIMVVILGALATRVAWQYLRNNIGVTISCTPEENIEKLKASANAPITPEVVMTEENVLDVAMRLYELRGLKAEMVMEAPDTTDRSVYLYCRSADYTAEYSMIGNTVANGVDLESQPSGRIGYLASADGNFVIGVARNERIREYIKTREGCFFRQFILVSNGKLPPTFYLHGKVSRRAIGRTIDDRYFFIETHNPETMWSFADALRSYGFIDAIYITGGRDYGFYRTADGTAHDFIHDIRQPEGVTENRIPWLVFKAK